MISPLDKLPDQSDRPGGSSGVRHRLRSVALGSKLILIVAGILLLTASGVWAEPPGPTEYEIKAACLYNFAKLIEWPDKAFASDKQPFSIGILGRDPFGTALERVIKGQTVRDREIAIRRKSGYTSCQLLFISSSEKENISRVLEFTEGRPIVTVSELEGFTELGGAIEFFIEENSVRFAINTDTIDRVGVELDPELVRVATLVENKPVDEESEPASEQGKE